MANLVPLLEVIVIGLLAALSWRILAAPPQGNAVGLAVFLVSALTGSLAATVTWFFGGLFRAAPVPRLAFALAMVPLTFFALSIVLTALARRRQVAERLARRYPVGRWPARLLNLSAVAFLWTVALAFAVGWATLAGVSPLRRAVEEHSLVLRHLLPAPPVPAAQGPSRIAGAGGPPGGPAAAGVGGASPGVTGPLPPAALAPAGGLVGFLARLTGAVELANWLLCVQEVARLAGDLGDAEKLLALQRLPDLRRVSENARLKALLEDEQVRALVEQCLTGDASAVARLAQNGRLGALLGDEQFRRELRALDVWALRQELARVRLPATRLQPDPWQVAVLTESETLVDCARDPQRWRPAGSGCVLVWPADARRGAARGRLQVAAPTRLVVYLDTTAAAVLQINGQSTELLGGPHGQLATADVPAGQVSVALAATLVGAGPARAITAEVFAEPLAEASP
jgi:hypothetical protein